MDYDNIVKLRIIYITCVNIAIELYPHENVNFIEHKAKEFYELATCRVSYVEKQTVFNK